MKLDFLDVSKMTLNAINKFNSVKPTSIEDIFEIDKEVKNIVPYDLIVPFGILFSF